jgi:hypothetical protein
MKSLFPLLLLALFSAQLSAQAQLGRKWDARFGGTDYESFYKIFRMPDGGYVMGGISNSERDGDKTSDNRGYNDYYIVRTDSVGNKLWDKSYGGSGYEIMWSMCVTPNGGILLAGQSDSGADGDKSQPQWGGGDYWVVRLDPQGNKLWDKRYGGTGEEGLLDARPCMDGGFILTGYSKSNASGDKSENNGASENAWVVRIDSLGNLMWEETYKSAGQLWLWQGMELPDGGFLFGGDAWADSTYDISEYGGNGDEVWIIRTDALGNKIWDKRYEGEGAEFIEPTGDGGFVVMAKAGGYLLFKIDSLGSKIWSKEYFGGGQGTGLSATSDGGFLVSEYTANYFPFMDKTEKNLGWSQTWILKLDTNGNKQWDKTIFTFEANAGCAIESNPGCYVVGASCIGGIGGYKTQPNWDTSLVTTDFWMVELCEGYIDTNLCPQQPCTGITETTTLQAKLYPNPTTGTLTIGLPGGQGGSMALYNLLGQSVYQTTLAGEQNTLALNLPPGLYLYRITAPNGQVQTGKVLVE